MSAAGWIKLHRAAIEHPCLQKLDALGVWCALLMRAARSPKKVILGGQAIVLQHGQLALPVSSFGEAGGVTRKRMRSILGLFRANQMIEMGQGKGHAFTVVTICNYAEWQGLVDDEGQAEGQAGAKLGPTKGQAGAKLGPSIEQEREKEEEEDSSLRSESPPAKAKRKLALGSRLPKDWVPSADDRAYAKSKGIDDQRIDRLAEGFVNYWIAQPGKAGLKVDWSATWRNRIIQVLDYAHGRGGPPRGGKSYNQLHREMQEETHGDDQGSETTFGLSGEVAILRSGRTDDDPRRHGGAGPYLRAVAGGL